MKSTLKTIFILIIIASISLFLVACGGMNGNEGSSAYEIWLNEGNTGTEADFLEWLKGNAGDKGEQGEKGESAYEIYKKYHPEYIDSEEEWILDLAAGTLARFTVLLDFQYGGMITTIGNLKLGSTIPFPAPTISRFAGWYKEAECINQWEVDDVIAGDIILYADWGTEGLEYSGISNNTYSVVSRGASNDKDIVIPLFYEGKAVSSVADYAFFEDDGIESLIIPQGIEIVGERAFGECSSLERIRIAAEIISKNAFESCVSLSIADIRKGVNFIDNLAFAYCESLEDIELPNTLTELGNSVFRRCILLRTATLPKSLTLISGRLFDTCTRLERIIIDKENTAYSGEGNCLIRRSDNSLIEGAAKSVIPNSVVSIGDYAFYARIGINSIYIPEGVESIGMSAFSACRNLQSIKLPNTLKDIGRAAFAYCSSLKSVKLPDAVAIGEIAFVDCTSLKTLTIPKDVISIGMDAFLRCTALEQIVVKEGNAVYKSEGNSLIRKEDNTLVLGCKNSIIPNYIETIAKNSFYEVDSMEEIVIPSSVKLIEMDAFFACASLRSIIMEGDELVIKDFAFSNNTSLQKVSFNYKKLFVGWMSFSQCRALEEINFNVSEELYIDDVAFSRCDMLTSIILPSSLIYLGWDVFFLCKNLTQVIILNGAEGIASDAFFTININFIILCEDNTRPDSWHEKWNSNKSVIYGCILSQDKSYLVSISVEMIENGQNDEIFIPIRKGYIFKGWSTNSDAIEAEYSSIEISTLPNSTILYAVWEEAND